MEIIFEIIIQNQLIMMFLHQNDTGNTPRAIYTNSDSQKNFNAETS